MTWSVVSSSASASYVNITLCRKISMLTYLTSSGVTYPLPSVNARDFEAFKILDVAQRIEPQNGNIVWWRGIFTIKSGKHPVGCRYVREARRMKASDYNPTMLKSCN